MPIKLVPTEFADLPQIARIQNAAFGPSEHSKALFPGGATNGALEKSIEHLQNGWKEDPTLTWWNAVDTESVEIVGAARWHTYFTERPESEWMKDDIPEDWGEGANHAACRVFFGKVHESRRRLIKGKPHILLAVLVTHPEQQRRGAGSALIKWGCDLADEKNLPTYLEATPAGYPVYKKQGFIDIDTFIFEIKPFTGRDGSVKFTNMMRPPKEA